MAFLPTISHNKPQERTLTDNPAELGQCAEQT